MSLVVPNTADILMLEYILNIVAQDGGAAPAGGGRRPTPPRPSRRA